MITALRNIGAFSVLVSALAFVGPAAAADTDMMNQESAKFFDEFRLGVFAHDLDGHGQRREDGANINAELLFAAPQWEFDNPLADFFFTPRPHIGASVNTSGGTSSAYAGFTWELPVYGPIFVEGSFGGAIHNGETDNVDPNKEPLGCRALFRESASVGADITDNMRLLATINHMSNAGLCDTNPGITDVGVSLGYRF